MLERDIVSTQYRRDESSDVCFLDGFLLRWLEQLDRDRIIESCITTIHLPCLVEKIFESSIGLLVFVIGVLRPVLNL
jgi:hypothetical protein